MTFDNIIDVAQLIVTPVGLYLAYLVFKLQAETFKLQGDTFRSQQEVADRDNKRFFYSIRPFFKIKTTSWAVDDVGGYETNLILAENNAMFLKAPNINFKVDGAKFIIVPSMLTGETLKIFQGDLDSNFYNDLTFKIEFLDETGKEYYQLVTGNLENLIISPPFPTK